MRRALALMVALATPSIGSAATMAYHLSVTDPGGTSIASVRVGHPFKLRAYAEDLRAAPQGVFAAYLDVTFDSGVATATGPVVHSGTYPNGASGSVAPGLVDEAGGFDGFTPLGGGSFLIFDVDFLATAAGSLTFASDPADLLGSESLLFGVSSPVLPAEITYGAVTVSVVDTIFADGFESGTLIWSSWTP